MRWGQRHGLLVIAVAMVLLAPVPAGAASASLPSAGLVTVATHDGSIGEPTLAMDDAGEATLAWIAGGSLRLATRSSPTGRWHVAPRSFPGGLRPQLVMDSAGDTMLAWEEWEGSALVIETAFRPAGHSWGQATPLSGDIREGQGRWHLAMNPGGDATIVWSQYRHQGFPPLDAYYVLAATMTAGSGTWSPPTELSGPAGGTSPDLALNAGGEAIVGWRGNDPSTRTVVVQATFGSAGSAGAPWSQPVTISGTAEEITEEGPRVAIGADGGALVTWGVAGRLCSRGRPTTLVAAGVPSGGSWSAPTAISRWGECPAGVQLAIGPAGRATALWESSNLRATDLRSASGLPVGDEWTPPIDLARTASLPARTGKCIDLCAWAPSALARLVPTRGGGVFAAWRQEGVGIVGSVGTKDGWSTPTTLAPVARALEYTLGTLAAAYRPQGEVLLAWARRREVQVDAVRVPPRAPAGSRGQGL